jgi:hypothetical protein
MATPANAIPIKMQGETWISSARCAARAADGGEQARYRASCAPTVSRPRRGSPGREDEAIGEVVVNSVPSEAHDLNFCVWVAV